MSLESYRLARRSGRLFSRVIFAAALVSLSNCGLIPERVSRDDPRLKPMFDAMARVDRRAMGFTPLEADADLRVEWPPRRFELLLGLRSKNYEAMLHAYRKASRTVAFRRTDNGYDWIGEQEIFNGPHEYDSVDGTFPEAIVVTYERVAISGSRLNTVVVTYDGEEPALAGPQQLSLDLVRPWLKKWGYY